MTACVRRLVFAVVARVGPGSSRQVGQSAVPGGMRPMGHASRRPRATLLRAMAASLLLALPAMTAHADMTFTEARGGPGGGEFDIRCDSMDMPARLLSGGNMQKLILARELSRNPRFILANQPVRGLDEGAIAFVHERLLAAKAAGAGVLLVSEDLDEILALADRIVVLVRGQLLDVPPEEHTRAGVGERMLSARAT